MTTCKSFQLARNKYYFYYNMHSYSTQTLFLTLTLSLTLTQQNGEAKVFLWLYDNSTHLNHLSASINSVELTNIGSPLPRGGIRGTMYLPYPRGACTQILQPSNITRLKRVALIDTNQCDLILLIFNLQVAGYSAVILPQDYYSINYLSPQEKHIKEIRSKISIPTVQINYAAIEMLMNYAYEDENKTYAWNPELSEVVLLPSDFNWQALLLSFGIVLAVSILTIICYIVIKLLFNFFKRVQRFLRNPRVRRMPTRRYNTITELYDKCPICLEDFYTNVTVKQLPCSHIYHVKCIDKWFSLDNYYCPLCKQDISIPVVQLRGSISSEQTPLIPPSLAAVEEGSEIQRISTDIGILRQPTRPRLGSLVRPHDDIRNYQSVP